MRAATDNDTLVREFIASLEGKPPGRLEIRHQVATADDGRIKAWREYFDLGPVRAAYEGAVDGTD